MKSSPCSPQLEKAQAQQRRPKADKKKQRFLKSEELEYNLREAVMVTHPSVGEVTDRSIQPHLIRSSEKEVGEGIVNF